MSKIPMRTMSDLPISDDPRAAKADVTNAGELFGDPFGDVEDGDMDYGDHEDMYGDAEEGDYEDGDLYGDINDESLGAYSLISGDVEDGDTRAGRFLRKYRAPLAIAGGATAAYFGARAIKRAIAKKKARKAAVAASLRKSRTKSTIRNQALVRQYSGKLARNKKMPFFQVSGAKMNAAPIDPMEGFVADMFKYNLDRQASDTPFFQETALATFAGGTWTATATGVATPRFYTGLVLQVGINYLNAAPGTIFQVTASLPTLSGVLTIAAQPWIFTIQKQYDVRFLFFPYQLVANRPFPVLGTYDAVNNITVQVTGLPAASAVSLVVPGSLHPWTVAMRNALIR